MLNAMKAKRSVMKTSTIEVGGLLSALSGRGVEKRLKLLAGVNRADVNYVNGSATVVYDEAATNLETIKSKVRECGYHCSGELAPKHVCEPVDSPMPATSTSATTHTGHGGHAHPVSAPSIQVSTHKERAKHSEHSDMAAHEMGHGAGMDLNEMARDMRNRFLICLAFTIPIFIYSPMGGIFVPPAPPLNLDLNLWLFILATIAVIYPSWPFFVAAWRALRNGVLNMAVLVVL
jgi:P-type Cu2+ transporter